MRRALGLALVSAAFLLALAWQRERSPFLRAEARRGEVAPLAAATGLSDDVLLALLACGDPELPLPDLQRQAGEIARLRAEFDDLELAFAAWTGNRDLAEQLRRQAGGDAARLHDLVRGERALVETVVRFSTTAERFAARRRR